MSALTRRNVTESMVSEALDDLRSSLTTTITNEIHYTIESLKDTVIKDLIDENKRLFSKCNLLEKQVDHLYIEIDDIHDLIYDIEVNVHDQQQRSRRTNIELHGIPNNISDSDLESACIGILNFRVQIPIHPGEIAACHRLPSRNGGTKPVILRFVCRKRRNEALDFSRDGIKVQNNYFGLADGFTKIYINENVSPYFKTIGYHCRQLLRCGKIFKSKSDYGIIKIKITEESKWIKINHDNFFSNLPRFFYFDFFQNHFLNLFL